MDKTRQPDLEQLRKEHKTEKDPNIRKAIDRAGKKIQREGKPIASMRQALLRAHRIKNKKRRVEEIKDIHDRIEKSGSKYQHPKAGY